MNINLKKHYSDLLFIPLGGSKEIGMNVNLYHLDGKWLMVDLGLGFANDVPGVSMLAPDISFIKSHKKNLLGLIITHIHEDHLGAVQYLWEELQVPIYATNFAAKFLKAKLEEYPFAKQVKINVIKSNKELNLDPFRIDFIGLTHSVPEMNALFIKTKHGNILHSGDWKFDPDPVVGNLSEKEKIKSLGDKGDILALICDSTNSLSSGRSGSEGDLFDNLKNIVSSCNQMVGVTTFASNIARIHTIGKVADACGRKVVLAGFSLRRLVEVAKKSGYFEDLQNFISETEIGSYDRKEILILSTGCQGESLAATMKISSDAHRFIKFIAGDTMIFSSKIIPGNEKNIFQLFNNFARKKVEVITEKDHFVHVSGHPNQDELKEMYELAKPQISIPVHGEFVHMKKHAELAKSWGVKEAIQVENGMVVKLSKEESKIVGFVPTGYFGIDGNVLVPLEGKTIKERRKLQFAGAIFISVVIDEYGGRIIGDIGVSSVGAYDFSADADSLEMLKKNIAIAVKNSASELQRNSKGLKNKLFKKKKAQNSHAKLVGSIAKSIKSLVGKNINELIGKKPIIEVAVNIV